MKLLVFEFPGQYGKVEKFILEAGYAKEDIPGLIDRTVGRGRVIVAELFFGGKVLAFLLADFSGRSCFLLFPERKRYRKFFLSFCVFITCRCLRILLNQEDK